MVVKKPGYIEFLDEEAGLRINISVKILDILDIDEVKNPFVVKIDLVREWFGHQEDTLALNNLLPYDVLPNRNF